MKKKNIIIFIGVMLFLLTLFVLVNKFKIMEIKSEYCDNTLKRYSDINGNSVYTYCLDKVSIREEWKKETLDKYLSKNDISSIIDNLKYVDTINDGEISVYSGNVKIFKCNTSSGNKDIYIVPDKMEYLDFFCK